VEGAVPIGAFQHDPTTDDAEIAGGNVEKCWSWYSSGTEFTLIVSDTGKK